MTLPSSGQISMSQVLAELRIANPSRTTPISLNDTDVRALARIPSGPIKMSDLWGKSGIIVPSNVSVILNHSDPPNMSVTTIHSLTTSSVSISADANYYLNAPGDLLAELFVQYGFNSTAVVTNPIITADVSYDISVVGHTYFTGGGFEVIDGHAYANICIAKSNPGQNVFDLAPGYYSDSVEFDIPLGEFPTDASFTGPISFQLNGTYNLSELTLGIQAHSDVYTTLNRDYSGVPSARTYFTVNNLKIN